MSAELFRRSVIVTAAMFGLAAHIASLSMPIGTANAQGVKPIQNPIIGNEDLGDLSQPQQALAQFYRAFNTRDLKMIDENFAHSDEVVIDNPLGGIRRGADEPHKMYEAVFMSPADVHVEFWDYTIHRAGGVFWAVGGNAARTVMVRPQKLSTFERPFFN
jgi:limonene-1,2-epoxide hydrolase